MAKLTLSATVRRAIERAPCSVRALAREAGLAHTTLTRIRDGETTVTPTAAAAIARALRAWGNRCNQLATDIEDAAL